MTIRRFFSGLTIVLAACESTPPATSADDDAGPSFVASQGDFTGFTSWESFDGGADAGDMLDGGVRTIYLNKAPPPGSTVFPLGTMLVETTQGAQAFGMAKRGGGFDPLGGYWEWFELSPQADGTVEIVSRGLGPTPTLGYGNTPPTGCVGCHLNFALNDYVGGTAVQLSSF